MFERRPTGKKASRGRLAAAQGVAQERVRLSAKKGKRHRGHYRHGTAGRRPTIRENAMARILRRAPLATPSSAPVTGPSLAGRLRGESCSSAIMRSTFDYHEDRRPAGDCEHHPNSNSLLM